MKLSNIQILRAMAAAFVVYVHALSTYEAKLAVTVGNPIVDLGDLGDLGVKLFFCISGFIIFNCSSQLPGGFRSSLDFFIKRCIRILPLYYAATCIYAFKLALQGKAPSLSEFESSLLFIPYADQSGLMRPVLGQGWTLNFEMVFYVLTTLLLLSRSRLRYHALVASLVLAVALNHYGLRGSNAGAVSALGLITTEMLLFFAGGVIVGMGAVKVRSLTTRPFGKLPPLVAVLTAVTVAVFAVATLRDPASASLLFWLEWVCCTFAVLAASIPDEVVPGFGAVLLQPLVKAGDGSYSTYLLHGFLMGPTARLLSFFDIYVPTQWFAALLVIVCTAAGVYCFRYFELPIQRALSNLWNARRVTEVIKRKPV
jgi:exopolysaccharide production protein ExoZ